jgi:hypothetical protein
MGAVFALLGCIFGNIFTLIGLGAQSEGLSVTDIIFNIDWTAVPGVLVDTSSPIDVLFYGLAIYEGYRFSFRRILNEELQQLVKT